MGGDLGDLAEEISPAAACCCCALCAVGATCAVCIPIVRICTRLRLLGEKIYECVTCRSCESDPTPDVVTSTNREDGFVQSTQTHFPANEKDIVSAAIPDGATVKDPI